MKKIILIIGLFLICIIFISKIDFNKNKEEEKQEVRGVFLSYIDYGPMFRNKSATEQMETADSVIMNLKQNKFNLLILQVRPFSDAIYKSSIYPSSRIIVYNEGDDLELDILEYFIKKAHENDIKVHAWINPYRIRSTDFTSDISKDNFYYQYLLEKNNHVEISQAGIYFNPASKEMLDYILRGVEEIVINYDIDGILYDDYFYPSKTIDLESYSLYQNNGGTLSIDEYRIANINNLLEQTNKIIKKHKKDVVFGISPSGNINNNLHDEYLDVVNILKEEHYVDYIMPQIYYGFKNETLPFINTINNWNDLIENKKIKLYIALALYKSGMEDKYAYSGKNEWINNSDVIMKQIIISRSNSNYEGFSIFRYEHLFLENKNQTLLKEVENLKSII